MLMKRYYYSNKKEISQLLKDNSEVGNKEQNDIVANILENIKENGYRAVREYTGKFDGVLLDEQQFKVSQEEFDRAFDKVDEEFIEAVKLSIANV